uniref:Snail family zinc finger 1b n=1 Tax=Astyanax mexicanus TaxID=7994 RepID=A0A8B9JMU5_ASTMX
MPRSFLVKKYFTNKKPNYSELESQNGEFMPWTSCFSNKIQQTLLFPTEVHSYWCVGGLEEVAGWLGGCITCSSPAALSRHQLTHCSGAEDAGLSPAESGASRAAFRCKHCPKEYNSLGALKMHIRSHTLPCVCTTCGKAFSRPWLLRGHIRTHTGERPFSCPHCNRAFADRSNLRAHLQTHSEVKKYQCGTCSRTFSRMSLLHKHTVSSCCPSV